MGDEQNLVVKCSICRHEIAINKDEAYAVSMYGAATVDCEKCGEKLIISVFDLGNDDTTKE